MAECLSPLSVGHRREPPMISERIIESVVEFPDAPALRNRIQRDDLEPRAPSGFERVGITLGQLRRYFHFIVDASLFRFEPRILEQRMIVGGILAHKGWWQSFILVNHERVVIKADPQACTSGFSTLV